jgi:hypothetical protein
MRLHQSLLYRQIELDIEKADKYQAKELYLMLLQQVFQKQNAVKHLKVGSGKLFLGLTEYQEQDLIDLQREPARSVEHYHKQVKGCLEVLRGLELELVELTARMLRINTSLI